MGDASVTREGAPDGTKEEMLIMSECAFGQNTSAVAGNVDGLRKLNRPVVGIGKLDENLECHAIFGPVDTHVWGHGCASTT